jgi:CDP-diacylglycerol--glycerol-3-phosphate 3-phosphatidyltransferase
MKNVNKNLPNNLTKLRIFLAVIVIGMMLFPFDMVNINFPKFLINGNAVLDVKLLIVAVLFVIASITDFFDGRIARKYNLVTDYGKVMDAIADKLLVNGLLIVLCGQGYIHPLIPTIIILRDTITNAFKMLAGENGQAVAAIKTGKFKTAFLMIGLTLKLIGNFPMELINISLDDFCLITATVLAVISGLEYYDLTKKYFKTK